MSENVKATCPNCKDENCELFEVYYQDNILKYRCLKCNLLFDKDQIKKGESINEQKQTNG